MTPPPFEKFHVSPIKLRKKTEPGKFRLIHNLSWPYDETSVNGGIEEKYKEVNYSSVHVAIKMIMNHKKGAVAFRVALGILEFPETEILCQVLRFRSQVHVLT